MNSIIWDVVTMAFQARRYVGAYLDWEKLTELLPQLQQEWKHAPASDLERVLSYFGYANDERFLGLLKTYLEHDLIRVRQVAVTAIQQLLCHLAYYCPEAILLIRQTYPALEQRVSAPNTPEKWQGIREMLETLEQDVRPYFHYYSI